MKRSLKLIPTLALGISIADFSIFGRVEAGVPAGGVPSPMSLQRKGERASVPLMLAGGLPTVAVLVNGRGPFRFVVDTGQPFSLSITPGEAKAMALEPTGEMLVGDPSAGASRRTPTFRAQSLRLGGLSYSQVDASAAAMARPGQPRMAGTIGMGLFAGLTLTIDYRLLRLETSTAALPTADGKNVVNASVDRMGLISIPLSIGDEVYQVHLDTGNGRFGLLMPADEIARLPTRGISHDIGYARTVGGRIPLRAIDLAARVRVGSTDLPIKAVAYPAPGPVGNVGSLGLAGTTISIDTRNYRVRILRPACSGLGALACSSAKDGKLP